MTNLLNYHLRWKYCLVRYGLTLTLAIAGGRALLAQQPLYTTITAVGSHRHDLSPHRKLPDDTARISAQFLALRVAPGVHVGDIELTTRSSSSSGLLIRLGVSGLDAAALTIIDGRIGVGVSNTDIDADVSLNLHTLSITGYGTLHASTIDLNTCIRPTPGIALSATALNVLGNGITGSNRRRSILIGAAIELTDDGYIAVHAEHASDRPGRFFVSTVIGMAEAIALHIKLASFPLSFGTGLSITLDKTRVALGLLHASGLGFRESATVAWTP